MSYLILPALIEGGLLGAAAKVRERPASADEERESSVCERERVRERPGSADYDVLVARMRLKMRSRRINGSSVPLSVLTPSFLPPSSPPRLSWQHHRAVCTFHANAKRETLEMVARCYSFANYQKAAELQR